MYRHRRIRTNHQHIRIPITISTRSDHIRSPLQIKEPHIIHPSHKLNMRIRPHRIIIPRISHDTGSVSDRERRRDHLVATRPICGPVVERYIDVQCVGGCVGGSDSH